MNRTSLGISVSLGIAAVAIATSPASPLLTKAHAVPLANQTVSTTSKVALEQVEISQQDELPDQAAPKDSEVTGELFQVALADQAVLDLSEVSVELAQLSPLDVLVNQLERYEREIEEIALRLARENSPPSLRWRGAVTDFDVRKGELIVTVYGDAPALFRSRRVRVRIHFKLNQSLEFEYERFHLHVSKCGSRVRIACRRARRRASRRIDAAIRQNEAAIENDVNRIARQLLRPFFENRGQLPTELSDRV